MKGKLRKHVPASTLVEVLVASIIFLTVFILSLDTSVRIISKQPVAAHKYMLIQDEIVKLKERYASGEHDTGTYSEEYEWGTVNIEISRYGDYEDINILKFETDIPNTITKFTYSYLFEYGS